MEPVTLGQTLWHPCAERVENASMTRFMAWVNREFEQELRNYPDLWHWSIDDIQRFWQSIARYYHVLQSEDYETVLADPAMPGADWFPQSKVNFAAYLLAQGEPENIAVYADSEAAGEKQLSWAELRQQVVALATTLRQAGVGPGDHVCAYLPISCEAVVAILATSAVGAVWSSCSPDFGCDSVVERFSQVRPKVFFAVESYRYGGKFQDRSEDVQRIVSALDSLGLFITLPWPDPIADGQFTVPPGCSQTSWQTALQQDCRYEDFVFTEVPFGHPLWVLYTSGTTGLPKGIVHSHGGVLLEFLKSGFLHDDLDKHSIKFFFTTTGWTMFNLLVGGLVTGGGIVVYDGNPGWPGPERLFELAAHYQVTYFGASPTHVNGLIAQQYTPDSALDLSSIRTVSLTGSPASPENFQWFYQHINKDLHVFSMSGGTDVAAAFVGGVPTLPVHAGLIQAPALGVDVCAVDDNFQPIVDEDGEMVIRQPMPSMPVYLLNDPDHKRYRSSYFDTFEGVWRQGDLIRFSADGSCIISGRSDSTLNRYGVRVGTSEIYRAVEAVEGIEDSLIVNLELPGATFYMPLFVALDANHELDDDLVASIRRTLAQKCSPRHVPDEIHRIDAVPYTLSGKKMEVPVKKLLSGIPMNSAAKRDACRNPDALDYFMEFARQHG